MTDTGAGNIVAGATATDRIDVSIDTSSAGDRGGSFDVDFITNEVAGSGLGSESVGSETVSVSGSVFNAASGGAADTLVDFGNFRVGAGGGALQQSTDVENTAPVDASFTESLVVGIANISSSNILVANNVPGPVIAGSPIGMGIAVGIDTDTLGAGALSESFDVTRSSDGSAATGNGINSLAPLDLGNQNVQVVGQGFALASPVIDADTLAAGIQSTLDFGLVLKGSTVQRAIEITNDGIALDPFQDDLGASLDLGSITSDSVADATGSATVGSGQSDSSSLVITFDTSTTGTKGGGIDVKLVSLSLVGLDPVNLPSRSA